MKLVYVSAKKVKTKIVVRVECISCDEENPIVKYFTSQEEHFDEAKLLALTDFFRHHPPAAKDSLTIFTGSHTLSQSWPGVFLAEHSPCATEWAGLLAELCKCHYIPDIREHGSLSDLMQDVLEQFLQREAGPEP